MTSCALCGGAALEPYFVKDGYRLARCRRCGLVAVTNPPDDKELERFYSFGGGYGLESRDDAGEVARLERLAAHHGRQLARFATAPGRLLDVGCSAGFFLSAAAGAGWEVQGVELNPGTAELASGRGFAVVRGRLEDAGLAAGSFDAVTLWDLLEHVPDPAATLREAHRLLGPDGVLAVSTPNLDGLLPRLSRPFGLLTGYWAHPEPPAHLFQFSVRTLGELLRRSGFAVVAVFHDRSPLKYTLAQGGYRKLARSPLRIAHALLFAPALIAGPALRAGDEITVVARREEPGRPAAILTRS